MSTKELYYFNQMLEILGQQSFYHTSKIESSQVLILQNKLLKWPPENLLPIYDLLRIFELHHSSEQLFSGLDSGNFFSTLQE